MSGMATRSVTVVELDEPADVYLVENGVFGPRLVVAWPLGEVVLRTRMARATPADLALVDALLDVVAAWRAALAETM